MGFSMENLCPILLVLIIMGMLGHSIASVHKVGGSAGWTILGNVDYNKWTSSDTFAAGDSLLFVYNSQFHNVKQVTRRDFLSCNATSSMATYTSGSDTVTLTTSGHFYFLCGFPRHCQAGQKLHVLVRAAAAIHSPSISPAFAPIPSPAAGLSPSPATASEDSARNDAVSVLKSTTLSLAMSGVFVFLVALVLY